MKTQLAGQSRTLHIVIAVSPMEMGAYLVIHEISQRVDFGQLMQPQPKNSAFVISQMADTKYYF